MSYRKRLTGIGWKPTLKKPTDNGELYENRR